MAGTTRLKFCGGTDGVRVYHPGRSGGTQPGGLPVGVGQSGGPATGSEATPGRHLGSSK